MKLPDVPWSSNPNDTPSGAATKPNHSQLPAKEVEIFDPSASDSLAAFYSASFVNGKSNDRNTGHETTPASENAGSSNFDDSGLGIETPMEIDLDGIGELSSRDIKFVQL